MVVTLNSKIRKVQNEGLKDDKFSIEKANVGETIDLKKNSGAAIVAKSIVKKNRNLARKKPYGKRLAKIFTEDNNNDIEDIIDLGDIPTLKPSKIAAIAAKKISEKYKDMRNKRNAKKSNADDIDFKITDSRVVGDDDIDFTVTDSRVMDDENIDFNVTDSRVVAKESDIDFALTDSV